MTVQDLMTPMKQRHKDEEAHLLWKYEKERLKLLAVQEMECTLEPALVNLVRFSFVQDSGEIWLSLQAEPEYSKRAFSLEKAFKLVELIPEREYVIARRRNGSTIITDRESRALEEGDVNNFPEENFAFFVTTDIHGEANLIAFGRRGETLIRYELPLGNIAWCLRDVKHNGHTSRSKIKSTAAIPLAGSRSMTFSSGSGDWPGTTYHYATGDGTEFMDSLRARIVQQKIAEAW